MLLFDTESIMLLEWQSPAIGQEFFFKLAAVAGEQLGKAIAKEHRLQKFVQTLRVFGEKSKQIVTVLENQTYKYRLVMAITTIIFSSLIAENPFAGLIAIADEPENLAGKPVEGSASLMYTHGRVRGVFVGRGEKLAAVVEPEAEVVWSLPDTAPSHVKLWENYISTVVDAHYATHRAVFEAHEMSPDEVKNALAAIIGVENGTLERSATGDWGPLQVNEIHFGPGEDPSDIWLQGKKAMKVFATALQNGGNPYRAFGLYNLGEYGNAVNPDYASPALTIYEMLSKRLIIDCHVVADGETLSQIAFERGVTYDQVYEYWYDAATNSYMTRVIKDKSNIRVGTILVFK